MTTKNKKQNYFDLNVRKLFWMTKSQAQKIKVTAEKKQMSESELIRNMVDEIK